jgi:hypothetical protein
MLWHRLPLLAITGASSYSHEGPLRPPKLVGKDKAVVAVVDNSMAARRDNPFAGPDLENATSAWGNQKVVCEMERQRAPWQPLPVPEATRCLTQGAVQMCSPPSKPTVPEVMRSAHCSTAVLSQLVRISCASL